MATRERESDGPTFGIAHGTVVPGNAGPDGPPGDEAGTGTEDDDAGADD